MTSVGRIMFSGMLEELPNLKFIHTMLAGCLYAFVDLITPKAAKIKEDRERFDPESSERARRYLKENIFCDITHPPTWGNPQLECAIKVMGADHILFGSGFGVRPEWLLEGVECIKGLDITEEERALVLGGNAMRLFNIKA